VRSAAAAAAATTAAGAAAATAAERQQRRRTETVTTGRGGSVVIFDDDDDDEEEEDDDDDDDDGGSSSTPHRIGARVRLLPGCATRSSAAAGAWARAAAAGDPMGAVGNARKPAQATPVSVLVGHWARHHAHRKRRNTRNIRARRGPSGNDDRLCRLIVSSPAPYPYYERQLLPPTTPPPQRWPTGFSPGRLPKGYRGYDGAGSARRTYIL